MTRIERMNADFFLCVLCAPAYRQAGLWKRFHRREQESAEASQRFNRKETRTQRDAKTSLCTNTISSEARNLVFAFPLTNACHSERSEETCITDFDFASQKLNGNADDAD